MRTACISSVLQVGIWCSEMLWESCKQLETSLRATSVAKGHHQTAETFQWLSGAWHLDGWRLPGLLCNLGFGHLGESLQPWVLFPERLGLVPNKRGFIRTCPE
jgi:hypothetical protein